MAIVYRYVLKEFANDVLINGIDASKDSDADIQVNGSVIPCILALLNPKDDEYKFNSNEYIGIKLDVSDDYCKIVDASEPKENDEIFDYEKYKLGTFKNPTVLIASSISPESISVLNKDIDIPVLYNNSRDLYYSCRVSDMLDEMSPKEAYVVLKNYFSSL